MRIRTFVVGCSLALALLVFGQRRPDAALNSQSPIPVVSLSPANDNTPSKGRSKKPPTKTTLRQHLLQAK